MSMVSTLEARDNSMIYKCNSNDNPKIISYIGKNYSRCLYLYMNFLKYGTESNTISIYIQENLEGIQAIYLFYYSCMHVFSKQNTFSLQELNSFLSNHSFSMIYCERTTALYIWNSFKEDKRNCFSISSGWVAQVTSLIPGESQNVQSAQKEDFRQIVEMLYADEDIGRSYTIDSLTAQLQERNQEGYARNLVIKDGATVVAHACTNAETNGLAVVAELVVKENYRRQGYGSEIWASLCNILLKEKKEVYSFYYSDASRTLHRKLGFQEVCEWTKIVFTKIKGNGQAWF